MMWTLIIRVGELSTNLGWEDGGVVVELILINQVKLHQVWGQ